MSAVFKPGTRVFGAGGSEGIIVRSVPDPIDLRIGGHPAALDAASARGLDASTPPDAAPAMGKRYVDATGTIEVLCTKAGLGAFAIGDALCEPKGAKPLPSSD
jgi:hypothetical protein